MFTETEKQYKSVFIHPNSLKNKEKVQDIWQQYKDFPIVSVPDIPKQSSTLSGAVSTISFKSLKDIASD